MISGYHYAANQSARSRADILIRGSQFTLTRDDGQSLRGEILDLDISSRVGNITRRITFPDGTLLETNDNEAIDQWITSCGKRPHLWLHKLETNLSLIIFSAVFVLALTVSFFKWGIPAISYHVAHTLPAELSLQIGEHSIDVLDSLLFYPSSIPEAEQNAIRERINQQILSQLTIEIPIKLHFREMESEHKAIANAFALPSGDIFITDELVKQLDQPGELDSVILHEIGHVEHRHGLQQIIRSSTITLLTVFVVGGDLSFGQDLIVAFPTFLTQQSYSRQAETEADNFALAHMSDLGLNPDVFADALEKIIPEGKEGSTAEYSFLSTHPDTRKRIEAARQYKH